VIGLTLGTTGVSVLFNFLGRDFFNALAEKDAARFTAMLFKWAGALAVGVPVFVFRDYYQALLALEWRQWLTARLAGSYLTDRSFYVLASSASPVDNPDQRITADAAAFTDAVLGLALTLLSAAVDLVSFSGILYSIYPPLFGALVLYAAGGTAASIVLGRPLVPLNFAQEAAEADLRYALVRVRENAEAVAFYGGEGGEAGTLRARLAAVVANGAALLRASRNLSFFTSGYRYAIQILPAAVVAPLYFKGAIEFGVVNQSSSAFNHILGDVSLVVYQIDALAGLAAVVDRLGQFDEAVEEAGGAGGGVRLVAAPPAQPALLSVRGVTLYPPGPPASRGAPLVRGLTFDVRPGGSLLIVGPSGAGKTSILRAAAGLWTSGEGEIERVGVVGGGGDGGGEGGAAPQNDAGSLFFVPQRPYMVLGSLRDQLLYPVWAPGGAGSGTGGEAGSGAADDPALAPLGRVGAGAAATTAPLPPRPAPGDAALEAALRTVRLGVLLDRADPSGRVAGSGLDATADWSSILSLGEQQRLAFARVLLARPALVLMDESTSALDVPNEAAMYQVLRAAGIAYVSVGHRPTLGAFHADALRLTAAAPGAGVASEWELGSAAELA
jgi:ABC-type uncharacterized transport system fused permease/ATPase subunit